MLLHQLRNSRSLGKEISFHALFILHVSTEGVLVVQALGAAKDILTEHSQRIFCRRRDWSGDSRRNFPTFLWSAGTMAPDGLIKHLPDSFQSLSFTYKLQKIKVLSVSKY